MLAVHGGVGENQRGVERLCAEAVHSARLDPVKAVMFLEDDGITNCGVGSSLSYTGTVECEAGYMSSQEMVFGGVGALANSKHPSVLAKKLALAQLSECKLTPPHFLVGNGANAFAMECEDVPKCSNKELITARSKRAHEKIMKMVHDERRWDTVGACAIKRSGAAAACTSSGGLILKRPGRIGHSAVFGAGTWAEQRDNVSISISLTGCGEAIVRTHLAERLAECTFKANSNIPLLQSVTECLRSEFLESRLLQNFPDHRKKVGGLIIVKEEECVELVSFHNEHHLPFAFFDGNRVRRRLSQLQQGQSVVFDSVVFKLA